MRPKQKRFCEEYMVDCNATQAAIRAGYSERTAKSIGQENLTKPDLAELIQALQHKLSKDTGITTKYVLDSIRAIADNEEATDNNRLRAYELLGRHLAMFTDKTEHTGSVILESVNYGTGKPFVRTGHGIGNN